VSQSSCFRHVSTAGDRSALLPSATAEVAGIQKVQIFREKPVNELAKGYPQISQISAD
jgi:hypothetical protein